MEAEKTKKPKAEKKETKVSAEHKAAAQNPGQKVAVVRIRNVTRASHAVRDTLKMLNIHNKFSCAVFPKTPCISGMLEKVKDYVTYGEVDDETVKLLEQKRAKKDSEGKQRKDFHLSPPRGGFERNGIKHNYAQGGASGYRGDKMNDLLKKMI